MGTGFILTKGAMSLNFQIVMLFLSDFYRNKRNELTEIISPDFTYDSPFFGEVNFDEYIDWMKRLSNQRSIVKTTTPCATDDENFSHEFLLTVLDFADGFEEKMIGRTDIIIRNGLIVRVTNIYEDETLNPDKFMSIKNKLIKEI